jgi:hypothetical protein
MNDVCNERHKSINKKLTEHDEKFKEYDDKIDTLTTGAAVHTTQIDNLCKEIHGLVTTTKWFIGLAVGSLGGFFFYAIQSHIFK